jgi:hypothetical protein
MSDLKDESEILFELVKQNYGDRLSEEQLKEVRSNVEKIVETAMELRKIRLDNSDEPFSIFTPFTRAKR